jgi:phenylpropionate dioxygenase-like ring-hydroxylating dioxygenase large terminal subunit
MMLENNMDPSHANSLHAGFAGFSLAAGAGMTSFQEVGAIGARDYHLFS